jgi:hypothetical protein
VYRFGWNPNIYEKELCVKLVIYKNYTEMHGQQNIKNLLLCWLSYFRKIMQHTRNTRFFKCFSIPNLKFHIFPPFSILFFAKALLTRCFFSLNMWWFFSMTHIHYAEVLQANAPCWTEYILTRANKFSPMNQSTNQRSCQVAAQIKDASLSRLALRNHDPTSRTKTGKALLYSCCWHVYIDGSIMKLKLF